MLTFAQKPNEQVQGLAADSVRGTYWVYTDQSIFELDRKSEDRDVWRIYLEKQQYDAALQYAKVRITNCVYTSGLIMTFRLLDGETARYCYVCAGPRVFRRGSVFPGSTVLRAIVSQLRGSHAQVLRRWRARRTPFIFDLQAGKD